MHVVPKIFGLIGLVALGACAGAQGQGNDVSSAVLSNLNETEREFLFADESSSGAFFGQPIDGGPVGCYPQRMNQAYVLIDGADGVWIDSVRPTGVERHAITGVQSGATSYTINARNGAGAPFALKVDRLGNDKAIISWDGMAPTTYQRCTKPNA
jgi:hypothetical protein